MQTLFINGRIYDQEADVYYNSMLVDNGIIQAIGNNLNYDCNTIDLNNHLILPTLLDIHMHISMLKDTSFEVACLPPNITSISDINKKLKDINAAWIKGWGFDEGKVIEQRTITKHDLDDINANVYIQRSCVHKAILNTKAINTLGLDPNDSNFDFENGIIKEDLKFKTDLKLPKPSKTQTMQHYSELSKQLYKKGIAFVSDGLATTDLYNELNEAINYGYAHPTVLYLTYKKDLIIDDKMLDKTKQIYVGGIKLLADGSISGKTACNDFPYLDGSYSNLTIDLNTLLDARRLAIKYHLPLVIHAMGNKTIRFIIESLKDNTNWLNDTPSIRIEHATFIDNDLFKQIKSLNIAIVSQPIFEYCEIESYLSNLNKDILDNSYQYKTILDNNILLAFSSDAPATSHSDPANPFIGLKFALNRTNCLNETNNKKEAINFNQALKCYTTNAARIIGQYNIGRLAKGYKANFIELNSEQIINTYIKGKIVA